MESIFDPNKNAENLRKHGISLAEGDGVLNDQFALTIEDDSSEGVRIISVRKPEPSEVRAYEEGI
jgi:uncharacterized DUF497 family protein